MTRQIVLYLIAIILLSSFSEDKEGNRRAFYECGEPVDIDTTLFAYQPGSTYFFFNKNLSPQKLKSKGFVWLDDQPEGYFTAYLVNTSDTTFTATRQDGSLIMIQEALNPKGNWKPIEYWVYSGCGNSYFDPLKLDSGKYVMIPVRHYKGSFKTKFRLKMKIGKTIFYSQTFDGSIEKSQFKKQTENVHGILYHGRANYLDEQ